MFQALASWILCRQGGTIPSGRCWEGARHRTEGISENVRALHINRMCDLLSDEADGKNGLSIYWRKHGGAEES